MKFTISGPYDGALSECANKFTVKVTEVKVFINTEQTLWYMSG